jgi:hypothetical protein
LHHVAIFKAELRRVRKWKVYTGLGADQARKTGKFELWEVSRKEPFPGHQTRRLSQERRKMGPFYSTRPQN